MVWADGVLYASTLYYGIVTIPAVGGDAVTLVPGESPSDLWVDGDNLFFPLRSQLKRVSRAGGDVTTVLDVGEHNPGSYPAGAAEIGQKLFDGKYFYWTTLREDAGDQNTTRVWRMPLAGGSVEGFPAVPIVGITKPALSPHGVIVASLSQAYVVPLDGGTPRELQATVPAASDIRLINTVDSAGVIWGWVDDKIEWTRMSTPADGSAPRPLSGDIPGDFEPMWSEVDGQSGRFVAGRERFSDGKIHGSVFHLAADGSAKRIACDAGYQNAGFFSVAKAPDALYMSVSYSESWTIVRVPR